MKDITLVWEHQGITSGSSWREVENAVRAEQLFPYATRREFRDDMRHRAKVWTGVKPKRISRSLPKEESSRLFLRSLADAGLFAIFTNDDELVGS